MITIGAGPGYRNHRGTVPAVLRTISVCENLKLRDGVNAELCAKNAGAGPATLPIHYVVVVKKFPLPASSTTGYRIGVSESILRRVSDRLVDCHSWREQDQLFEVATIQGQLAHLSRVDKIRNCGGGGLDLRHLALHRY